MGGNFRRQHLGMGTRCIDIHIVPHQQSVHGFFPGMHILDFIQKNIRFPSGQVPLDFRKQALCRVDLRVLQGIKAVLQDSFRRDALLF